jgi:hypothetical protein
MYLNNFAYNVDWELTSVDVVNYDSAAAVASVSVGVMTKSASPVNAANELGAVPSTIHEKWIHIGNEWWYSTSK